MLEANWKRELLTEQQKVVKDCLCPNCGGEASNQTLDCEFCGSENLALKEDVEKITDILGNLSEEELKDPFVMISLLKLGKYSSLVSDLSREDINREYLSWAKKMIAELTGAKELSNADQEALINLFDNGDYYQDQFASAMQNIVIANTASQAVHYSPELVYGALQQNFCQIIKKVVNDATLEKKKLEEDTAGETQAYVARIDEENFDNFIHHGGTFILNTLGHEARHVYQNYKRYHRIVEDRNDLIMFYESMIRKRNQKIYDDNYYHMLIEVDARVYGLLFEQHFRKMMFGALDESKKKEYAADYALLTNHDTMRVIDGKKVRVEEETLSLLNEKPQLYNKYSQFHYEFVKDNGHIRFKTTSELIDDYFNNKDSAKDNLYLELVKNSKNREVTMGKNQQISSTITM